MKKLIAFLLIAASLFALTACSLTDDDVALIGQIIEMLTGDADEPNTEAEPGLIAEDGTYTSRDDVALYLYTYGHLPDNFITKKEAQSLGWNGGSLDEYAYGKCIGGDWFGNYEKLLPVQKGREYHECDINTLHADSRGGERLVFSNDGLIYYTGDHYNHFTLLYGED